MTAISDHAVLRYLEWVKGVDIDRVRAEMQTPALQMADDFGCPVLIGRQGERMVINKGVVVTVLPARVRKVRR